MKFLGCVQIYVAVFAILNWGQVHVWPTAGDPVHVILMTLDFSKYVMVVHKGGTCACL